MRDLAYVEVTFHFEVSNSEWFGGEGSVGYISQKLGGVNVDKLRETLTEERIRETTQTTAGFMKVSIENIKLISKEEYDQEVDEENEGKVFDKEFQ